MVMVTELLKQFGEFQFGEDFGLSGTVDFRHNLFDDLGEIPPFYQAVLTRLLEQLLEILMGQGFERL